MSSPFAEVPHSDWVASNNLAFAIRDLYPVSDGHTLVIPRRVVATWFDASREEQVALFDLVETVKRQLDATLKPDGYNVGFNAGQAAGQTVDHLHVHVIPRYEGDVDDPRGGVRFVIPRYGNYKQAGFIPRASAEHEWAKGAARAAPLVVGGPEDPFGGPVRRLLERADRVSIVAAFVQHSGVETLSVQIDDALERGATIRVVTGDYLDITQVQALRRLLDWTQLAQAEGTGSFSVRVIETKRQDHRAFHPKSWRFEGPNLAVAFVGSSNWSRSALGNGVEWNLRMESARDPAAYEAIVRAFEQLWACASPLDEAWLAEYARRSSSKEPLPTRESEDIVEEPVAPRDVQEDALEALARSRDDGRERALVVLATGLGKTFLAAFDIKAFFKGRGLPPRVLFLVHRRELLIQASATFRRVFPHGTFGFFHGTSDDLSAEFVFASVQKLTRPEQLKRLSASSFDYVVVDEVHHAAAPTYRRLLAHLEPKFLLGLTATPDRADQGDIGGIFDDHIAFRATLGEGIQRGLLVPFHYRGLADTTEYEPIPWRRFTVEHLARLVETEARMSRLYEAWCERPATRTLVFCVSIGHTDYVAQWLKGKSVRIAAVHSGETSARRGDALEQLDSGQLEAIAAVDLFNEGIDVPRIDRVVMLRPTDSPLVFLQQLGRGLRISEDKEHLEVIDFVGNHKVFLGRVRTLLSLAPAAPSLPRFLERPEALKLPAGCRVDITLEAIDLLTKLMPASHEIPAVQVYRELRDERGTRPTPGELIRLGQSIRAIRKRYESWFTFVGEEDDLGEAECKAYVHGKDWLHAIEASESLTKCFKMVVLEVLLASESLFDGMPLDQLARRSHAYLLRNPVLFEDLKGVKALQPDPRAPDPAVWRRYWRKNPIDAWTKGQWFFVENDVLRFRLSPPKDLAVRDALVEMKWQLVDARLARYQRRARVGEDAIAGESSFVCNVSHNSKGPILFLPTKGRERLPHGETEVRLEDGSMWQFRFVKVAVNIARPIGSRDNKLPDLLRQWFGPSAGASGTRYRVQFRRAPNGWWVEPLAAVFEFVPKGRFIAYPSLEVAAGTISSPTVEVEADRVRLPFETAENRFATRAFGDSMCGGSKPICDGDWVVFEWARSLPLGAVDGRVVLVAQGDPHTGFAHHLKRLVKTRSGFEL
ncbi:MAG: DEAD/DEAH box helicase family protein, partial [Myxococcales bacterium]|nr:DEAD/DEAH box helicase family protein [Myxococcales bacterium]